MQILVLLDMYFDAVVVFVTSQTLLFRLALAILCHSLYNSINSAIVALKSENFIDVNSIQVISGFNLNGTKKIARWRCSTKISKTNLKTMISPLLTRPQGCQGCQKIWKTKLKTTLVSWSAKIQPKLNKIQKTFRKQGFFDNFCSILTVFHSFFNFG